MQDHDVCQPLGRICCVVRKVDVVNILFNDSDRVVAHLAATAEVIAGTRVSMLVVVYPGVGGEYTYAMVSCTHQPKVPKVTLG